MSVINIDSVKATIFAAVEKAIEECAIQHDYNKEYEDSAELNWLGNSQPEKLSLKFEFYWPGKSKCSLFCNPVIDLKASIK